MCKYNVSLLASKLALCKLRLIGYPYMSLKNNTRTIKQYLKVILLNPVLIIFELTIKLFKIKF